MEAVALFATEMAAVLPSTITSTGILMKSAINPGRLSYCPSAKRHSAM